MSWGHFCGHVARWLYAEAYGTLLAFHRSVTYLFAFACFQTTRWTECCPAALRSWTQAVSLSGDRLSIFNRWAIAPPCCLYSGHQMWIMQIICRVTYSVIGQGRNLDKENVRQSAFFQFKYCNVNVTKVRNYWLLLKYEGVIEKF